MSCSLKSNILRYSHSNQSSNQQNTAPEMPVIVLVLCACMIALQGSGLDLTAKGMAQKERDAATEYIFTTQMHLFTNIQLDKNSRG